MFRQGIKLHDPVANAYSSGIFITCLICFWALQGYSQDSVGVTPKLKSEISTISDPAHPKYQSQQKFFSDIKSLARYRKAFFIELLGNGIGFSANFDMRLKPDRNDGWGISAGAGILPDYGDNYISFPLGLNHISGKRKSGLESGIGITALYNKSGNENLFIDLDADEPHPKLTALGILHIGYRFQATKGLMFRATNSLMYIGKGLFSPIWPGLSIGYSFNKNFSQLVDKEKEKKQKEDLRALLALQDAHKSSEYISFDFQPLFRTGTTITKTTDRDVLSNYNLPGFAVGVDYNRVSRSGFTFISGIHFRMIPAAYKFSIEPNDFPSTLSDDGFGKTNSSLNNGHLYFPVQMGYTTEKRNSKWQASLTGGLNLSHLQDYGLFSTYSYSDDSGGHPLQDLTVDYPARKLWIAYAVNLRAWKLLRRGNQVYFGINSNFSGVTYNYGEYNLYTAGGKQSGTFTDKGSYIALQFGFSLVRRYKEPEKF